MCVTALVQSDSGRPSRICNLESFLQDTLYALRMLRKSPGFTAVTVITLALGLGASTAMFTVVDRVLLRPLPYHDADRLVLLEETSRTRDSGYGATLSDIEQWRARSHAVSQIAFFSGSAGPEFLEGNSASDEIAHLLASANLFATLGVSPLRGRDFLTSDQVAGSDKVAILSDGVWQQMYGGDAHIIGKTVRISGTPYTVIGVMPPMFVFPIGIDRAQIWTPLVPSDKDKSLGYGMPFYRVIARLAPGATAKAAQSELSALQQQLVKGYSDPSLREEYSTVCVRGYGNSLVADQRSALLILAMAVGVVWLIACVNVANLMLVRGTTRQREIAIRVALGASRRRILQQLLTESLILSATGATLGLGSSAAALRLFHYALQTQFHLGSELTVNRSVVAALLALTVVTALCFGLAPAIAAVRMPSDEGLREGSMQVGLGRRHTRIRNLLVVGEIGLSLTLLVSCGLLLRTLYALRHVPLGFRTDHVIIASMKIPAYRYAGRNLTSELYTPLLDRVQNLPGVEAASLMSGVPLESNPLRLELYANIGDSPGGGSRTVTAFLRVVSPDFQNVMGFRILRGRFFNADDTPTSQPVVVVNRAFARLYWHTDEVIGRELLNFGNKKRAVVVGIMDDLRQDTISKSPQPEIEISLLQMRPGNPFYQSGEAMTMDLALRTSRSPESIVPEVRRLLQQASPELRGANFASMDQVVANSLGSQILAARLLGIFAGAALLIALAGLYGLLAYLVTQRTREFGIRFALGAQRVDILCLVMRQAFALLLGGFLLGWVLARASTGLLRRYLYGVGPNDAATVAVIGLLLLASGMVAAYIPARRAALVDPVVALRCE